MARSMREAKLEAVYGDGWAVVSEMGGRQENHDYRKKQVEKGLKKALLDWTEEELEGYRSSDDRGSALETHQHTDEPSMEFAKMDSYEEGSLGDPMVAYFMRQRLGG